MENKNTKKVDKKPKKYSEFAIKANRTKRLKKFGTSIFPEKEGVYLTPQKDYVVRCQQKCSMGKGTGYRLVIVAKYKTEKEANQRLLAEQKIFKEQLDKDLENHRLRRLQETTFEREESINVISGFAVIKK